MATTENPTDINVPEEPTVAADAAVDETVNESVDEPARTETEDAEATEAVDETPEE